MRRSSQAAAWQLSDNSNFRRREAAAKAAFDRGALERDLSATIPDAVCVCSQAMRRGKEDIRHRRARRANDMLAAADRATGASGQDQRNEVVTVDVRIAHGASVKQQRVMQQIGAAILGVAKALGESGKLPHVKGI